MIPRLVGRLCSACPDLKIRKCRILLPGSGDAEPREERIEVTAESAGPDPVSVEEPAPPPPEVTAAIDPLEISRTYLRRAAERRGRRE
jgi:hypothetical protein